MSVTGTTLTVPPGAKGIPPRVMKRKVRIDETLSAVKWIEKGEGIETLVTDSEKPKNDSIMRLSGSICR